MAVLWVGIFAWGVVSLLAGNWTVLAAAGIIWCGWGLLYISVERNLTQVRTDDPAELRGELEALLSHQDWERALQVSSQLLTLLSTNYERAGHRWLGPLTQARLTHGVILGAIGELEAADEYIFDAAETLEELVQLDEEYSNLRVLARAILNDPLPSISTYQMVAGGTHPTDRTHSSLAG